MALSLYRKYRPEVFSDVVGQAHVVGTLLNAIRMNNLAHAYMFCGPRGTGKTTTARLLAKALMCKDAKDGMPCGKCESCIQIANGTYVDVYELDAASRTGVENVREEIISRVGLAPTQSSCKVYIIDEVHMLSVAAFNALLKTLEEPPEHVYFVLCTTDPHKVLETIQSRCQRFDFHRLGIEEIVSYLRRICDAEGVKADTEALSAIAVKSNGGMRDATTALEQTIVACDGRVSIEAVESQFGQNETAAASGLFDLCEYISGGDVNAAFAHIAQLASAGTDFKLFAHSFSVHVRNLYVTALTGGKKGMIDCSKTDLAQFKNQAERFSDVERLASMLYECGELMMNLRTSADERLTTEIAIMRMCGAGSRPVAEFVPVNAAKVSAVLDVEEAFAESSAASTLQKPKNSQDLASGVTSTHKPESEPAIEPEFEVEPKPERMQETISQPATVPTSVPAPVPASVPTPVTAPASVPAPVPASVPTPVIASASVPTSATAPVQNSAPTPTAVASDSAIKQTVKPAKKPTNASSKPYKMSLARLQAAFYTEVRRQDVPTGAILDSATLEMDGDNYKLVFPKNARFALTLAQAPDASRIIKRAFNIIYGEKTELSFVLEGSQGSLSSAASQSATKPSSVSSTPLHQQTQSQSIQNSATNFQQAKEQADSIESQVDKEMADMLSAFGEGIKIEKIEE